MPWIEMLFTLLTAVVALAAVLALAYVTLKWMGSKMPGGTAANGRLIRVLDRTMVGQDKCLLVVQVGEQTMLVGMSSGSVQKLCDLPELSDWQPAQGNAASPEFSQVLRDAVSRGWSKLSHKGEEDHEG